MPFHYRSPDEDSARWDGFEFREDDIIISTRSKHGTTWMQMICALLVFRGTDLPRPLYEISPWLDWTVRSKQEIWDELESQQHRRIIKTHTPLDGIPIDSRATYIVVGRHPLDAAVSLYHQSNNLNRARMAELAESTFSAQSSDVPTARLSLEGWLSNWISANGDYRDNLDSITGVFHHLDDAWKRQDKQTIVLVHYEDLSNDLETEVSKLAKVLGIPIDPPEISMLSTAASFESMRENSGHLAPDPVGVLQDHQKFFRRGQSGEGVRALDVDTLASYYLQADELAPSELLAWLHRPTGTSPKD